MASKVNVIYTDLNTSAKNLETISDSITDVINNITSIENAIDECGGKHDNCFSETINLLNNLKSSFLNHREAIDFLKSQCISASNAFQNQEGNVAAASNAMLTVINRANMMLGKSANLNADDVDINVFNNSSSAKKANIKLEKVTAADTSKTWKTVFTDKNGHFKVNSDISKYAYSTVATVGDDDDIYQQTGTTSSTGSTAIEPKSGAQPKEQGENKNTDKKDDNSKQESTDDKQTGTNKSETTTENTDTNKTTTNDDIKNLIEEKKSLIEKPQEKFITQTNNSDNINNVNKQNSQPADTPVQVHIGGGYSKDNSNQNNGYVPTTTQTPQTQEQPTVAPPQETTTQTPQTPIKDSTTSPIDDVVKSNKYTKIPTSSTPITTQPTNKSKGTSSVIPIAAGLTAAAAAGIGAKAYMDHKKNNESEEDDDINAEEWSDEYNTSTDDEQQTEYLEEDNNYSYEEEPEEKYGARSNEELADLQ